jgi:hypothetical protein
LRLAQEAAERARVQEALEDDSDDDLGADPTDETTTPCIVAVSPRARTSSSTTNRSATTMSDNKDIAVLAKKVYELSVLPVEALDARKWEALLILNAVYSSATPEGIDKANADKAARWGAQIQQEGLLSQMHPKWHLRTDDGKPPAARHALESALSNPPATFVRAWPPCNSSRRPIAPRSATSPAP